MGISQISQKHVEIHEIGKHIIIKKHMIYIYICLLLLFYCLYMTYNTCLCLLKLEHNKMYVQTSTKHQHCMVDLVD